VVGKIFVPSIKNIKICEYYLYGYKTTYMQSGCPSNLPVPFILMGGERLRESKDVLPRNTSLTSPRGQYWNVTS